MTNPSLLFEMSSFPLLVTILAFSIPTLTVIVLARRRWRVHLNLPPGPPGWPVVGNLFQVVRSGKPFFEYVADLRRKYGPIMTLHMGTRTMIILSDARLVHEALVERGAAFASRPRENSTRNIFSANKFTVNAAVYGPVWRSLRKNMVQNMLASSRLKEFRSVRERAMDRFIDKLQGEAKAENGAVWILKNVRFAVFDILVTMSFGILMDKETVEKMDLIMKKVLINLDPRIDDFLPILSPLFYKERKKALELRRQQIEFIYPFIEQRKRALKNPGSDERATSFSYLDTLFELKIEGRDAGPTKEELVTLCSEFLNGGTDTTGTALEWAIAQLIANPDIQDKLYNEVRSVVGLNGKVNEKDVMEKMPYLEAFVKELFRKHPPTPFSLTHAATETTKLAGYDIPADANLEIFFSGISDDPGLWPDPGRFDPARFSDGKGDLGGNDIRMVPFGVGRRVCPGLTMATVHVHLMVARMVHAFEWSSYPPGSELDFSGKVEFTVVMKNTLRAVVKRRV